ncbi:MAG: nucleotidyltransferase substrate binding protein [Bdellovibrionia bacterium]
MQDIRWHQRLDNYESALSQLKDAVELSQKRALSELEKQGLIQAFEFTHELAWNVLKDYLAYQGTVDITGSRDAVREAFSRGILKDGHTWMEMIQSRNKTSHTYNKSVSDEITDKILNQYFKEFQTLQETLLKFKKNNDFQ